jgi:hypothetical protein
MTDNGVSFRSLHTLFAKNQWKGRTLRAGLLEWAKPLMLSRTTELQISAFLTFMTQTGRLSMDAPITTIQTIKNSAPRAAVLTHVLHLLLGGGRAGEPLVAVAP